MVEIKHDLSPEEFEEVKAKFMVFDVDGDGTIAIKAFDRALGSLGFNNVSTAEQEELLLEYVDGYQGPIDFPEFLKIYAAVKKPRKEKILAACKAAGDKGAVSKEVFSSITQRYAYCKFSNEEINSQMRSILQDEYKDTLDYEKVVKKLEEEGFL